MFEFLTKFFKKKPKTIDCLEDAFNQNLITKEEFLRLKKERAETELKEYLKKKK